jgi:hypothetical protein
MKVPFSGSIHALMHEPRSGVHDGGCDGQHVVGGAMSCGHGIIPWTTLEGVHHRGTRVRTTAEPHPDHRQGIVRAQI